MSKTLLLRRDMLSKVCDRCGNDFAAGKYIVHLPFSEKYIVLCSVCVNGLGMKMPDMTNNAPIDWKKFWNSDYSEKKIINWSSK